MKYILTIILLMAPVFNEIAEINKHKKQAREAYVNGDYETALISLYLPGRLTWR